MHLYIQNDEIWACVVVRDNAHLKRLAEASPNEPISCSSMLDFPEEVTDSEGTISLARAIRGLPPAPRPREIGGEENPA